jgi:TRAP-type C4-dicarboxylate transport system permease small subunit
MRTLRAVYRFLCKAEEAICGVGFAVLVFLVFGSAILRLFRLSMAWNIDMAMLLLAWTAFLGADVAYRAGQLVGVDLLTRNLPKNMQKLIQILIFLIIGIALGVIVIFGFRLARLERLRTFQSIPIPFSVVTLSMTFAALSMLVSTIIKIRRCILNFNREDGPVGQTADQAGLT